MISPDRSVSNLAAPDSLRNSEEKTLSIAKDRSTILFADRSNASES